MVSCRRCGCSQWRRVRSETETFNTKPFEGLSPVEAVVVEFRCLQCGTKARIDETAQLEALIESGRLS